MFNLVRMRLTGVLIGWLLAVVSFAQGVEYQVLISTNMGAMRVKLYNDTPMHRDNFLKLVEEKHFDGTLFYRVVRNFVIQGGSSDSRYAPAGARIGYGDASRVIDSEFRANRFHKKGAICAPRQPEAINHFKMSDVSQFYIVKGKVFTSAELDLMEQARNNPIMVDLKKRYYLPKKDALDSLKSADPAGFNKLLREIKEKINFEYSLSQKLELTEQQREAYTTVGGCPELDGEYTVFGEVVEGLDVIDKIAALAVDKNDRPLKDVKITVSIVKLNAQ
jgi:cyclophilin family peptidyl-prolyl cis-trans isomerase